MPKTSIIYHWPSGNEDASTSLLLIAFETVQYIHCAATDALALEGIKNSFVCTVGSAVNTPYIANLPGVPGKVASVGAN